MSKGYRYSLGCEEENGDIIYLSIGDKRFRKKLPLTQIDAFTTRLGCEEELRLFFEYVFNRKLDNCKFFVEYIQDKKVKKIDIVYKDNDNLKYFSNSNIGKTYVDIDMKFETYVTNLLYDIRNDYELYNYLVDNKYINKYVLDKISNYLEAYNGGNDELINYCFKMVLNALRNYRVIRNIENGIGMYKKNVYKCENNGQFRLF